VNMPLFFNLDGIVAAVTPGRKYVRFVTQVRRYKEAMSALNDFRDSADCLEMLAEHNPLKQVPACQTQSHQITCGALLSHAILLYVRAAKTSSKHRGALPVLARMPADFRAVHERMVALRDNAIAHYGPGPGGARPDWARETTALRMDGQVASLALLYSRTTVQTDLPGDLRRLLSYAVNRGWEIASERADQLLAEGARLSREDREFVGMLEKHAIDLHEFFGGDEAAVQQAIASDSTAQTFEKSSYFATEFPLS
jgi:hypothetical protein